MQTIWKYELNIELVQSIPMPMHADILCVQMQGAQLCLWARVDPARAKAVRRILIVGTGNPMSTTGRYIGTVQTHDSQLVWHVFEG